MEKKTFIIAPGEDNLRIDKLLTTKLEGYSRSQVQQLIEAGQVSIKGRPVKGNMKGKQGDAIEIVLDKQSEEEIVPEAIPLEIIYEDEDLLVINKPQGLVVHPAPGNKKGTLVNALLYYYPPIGEINDGERPGIVHRLDKDTSGLMVVAKNDFAFKNLGVQFKAYQVKRHYLAIAHGKIEEEGGRIEAPIGRHPMDRKRMAVTQHSGKPALTEYWVKKRFKKFSLVEIALHTGRTHQIRVHLAYLGHPILGDPVYGSKKKHFGVTTQMLHAYKLGFIHPRNNKYLEFSSPLPEDFNRILELLESEGEG